MAGYGPRRLIAEALEDLEDDDLERFMAQMRRPRADNIKPEKFRRGQLKNKNCRQIADILVDAFSEDKSVGITLWLLRQIPLEDAAVNLAKAYADENPAAPAAPAAPAPRSQNSEEHFVDMYREELTGRVSNINPILDRLLLRQVLQQEQYDEAMSSEHPTPQAKMRFLYNGPLKSGGNSSKDILLSALWDLQPDLMKDLGGK